MWAQASVAAPAIGQKLMASISQSKRRLLGGLPACGCGGTRTWVESRLADMGNPFSVRAANPIAAAACPCDQGI
jgi:hypothetical protein